MEWAASHPIRALLLQLNVILDYTDDVSLPSKIVDESLGVTHCRELKLPYRGVGDFTRSSGIRKLALQIHAISFSRRFSQINAETNKSYTERYPIYGLFSDLCLSACICG